MMAKKKPTKIEVYGPLLLRKYKISMKIDKSDSGRRSIVIPKWL
jgi:hypothetical protein